MNYARLNNIFEQKWGTEPWFKDIVPYMISRYFSIEERLIDTFRYVEPHPNNRLTFSYEYSSILRDTGSVFDSIMRRLLEGIQYPFSRKEYNIIDYRKFLGEYIVPLQVSFNIPLKIESVAVGLNSFSATRFLMPFSSLENDFKKSEKDYDKIDWWNAYNNVKHSDIDRITDGNLVNCLNSVAALGILHVLMNQMSGARIGLFSEVGLFEPIDFVKKLLL